MGSRFGAIVALGVAISTADPGRLQAQVGGTLQVVARVVDTREGEKLRDGARAALRRALDAAPDNGGGLDGSRLAAASPDYGAGRLLFETALVGAGADRRLVVTVADPTR